MNTTCDLPRPGERCDGRCHERLGGVGSNVAHCTACHETFGGLGGFDRHQHEADAEVVCVDPGSLGMTLNDLGRWVRSAPDL